MSGFLWDDDADGFFGEASPGSVPPKKSQKPRKSEAVMPGASSESPLSVTQLNEWIKALLTEAVPPLWVAGEIGNLVLSAAGHAYFTLKDSSGQISAVMWRSTLERSGIELREGMAVLVHGRLDVYPPRGNYQLVVQKVEEQGLGALQAAFRKLFQRLQREGLFDAERKKELPRFPERIGFVTSPSGAAIHDFAQVLRRRWPSATVIIIPSKVQGAGSAEEIARGIEVAALLQPPLDVLVVGRGGGSLEDLWSFNEEVVVRAIANCPLPTISAVGHEIDVTLCDLAADVRALTPSEAAERVVPNRVELLDYIDSLQTRLFNSIQNQWSRSSERLLALQNRPILEEPERLLELPMQRVDDAVQQLDLATERALDQWQKQIEKAAEIVEALSPLKTLGRGYSLTTDASSDRLITDVRTLQIGDRIKTKLESGEIESQVLSIKPSTAK